MRKWVRRAAVIVVFGAMNLAPLHSASATLLNNSLFFYKHTGTPNAYRATVRQGVYSAKGSSTLVKGWTAAAVSRDTMMLYNANTGKAVTGTFTGGVWKPLHHYTLFIGLDQVVASCDSVYLHASNVKYAEYGTLTGGAYHRTTVGPPEPGWMVAASCDSFLYYNPSNGAMWTYTFNGGVLHNVNMYEIASGITALAATDDSLLVYDGTSGEGAWGTFRNGVYTQTGTASDFSLGLTNIAATATSIIYYRRGNAVMSLARLVNGAYTFTGTVSGVDKNWAVLAGGK